MANNLFIVQNNEINFLNLINNIKKSKLINDTYGLIFYKLHLMFKSVKDKLSIFFYAPFLVINGESFLPISFPTTHRKIHG
jgi:hypothetical protein